MRNIFVIILLLGFALAQTESFNPEDYRNREITALRLDQPLEIDGILDEALYSTKSNGPFIQYEPNNTRSQVVFYYRELCTTTHARARSPHCDDYSLSVTPPGIEPGLPG